jgi:hypothetical protein
MHWSKKLFQCRTVFVQSSSQKVAVMKKAELVAALVAYADHDRRQMRGQAELARYLAYWFNELKIRHNERYDFWQIEHYLPQLLLRALDDLHGSDEQGIVQQREVYEQELGPFPNLTKVGVGDMFEQAMVIRSVGQLIADITDLPYLKDAIDTLFNAERHLIEQGFYRFLSRVYSQGLVAVIDGSSQRGMSGQFGQTTLRSYVMAGRLMLTFARGDSEHGEQDITFVCEEGDELGLASGMQSCYADVFTALAMFDDVISGWPSDPEAQIERFTARQSVTMR